MADAKQNEVDLPGFLLVQPDGVFVDLALYPSDGSFAEFIERLFGAGKRFRGLDHPLLSGLLYDPADILHARGSSAKVKLAAAIVDFPSVRKALYKAVKVDGAGSRAEYFFEPPMIEVVSEVPVYGEPGEDGVAPVTGTTQKTELQPTQLDLDEFIADMWLKGVRYGIEADKVAKVIANGETVRMDVAFMRDATSGRDAEVEEATSVLHRDNSPKILPNGQADLRKFQNRFPQIAAGERLLKKRKRVLGKPGYKVSGVPVLPPESKDFDLQGLAGEGTKVESDGANEFIVSVRDGFLALDHDTNLIAVTEKIENKSGVSAKTTGDLSLAGNEFIEHGEVQEGRIVEGKNMTFRSDVYGDLVSRGGLIQLERNLSGGSAKSIGGDIVSNGRALNAVVEAWEGKVTLKYAEDCLILAGEVEIERAVNCVIAARTVHVGKAEGCGVAGKVVRIDTSATCRDKETIVSMLIPSLANLEMEIGRLHKTIADARKIIAEREQEQAQIEAGEEVVKFRALETSIQHGDVKLNAAQQEAWHKMCEKFVQVDRKEMQLNADKREQAKRIAACEPEIARLMELRKKSGEGIHCEIGAIAGDTLVRTLVAANGIDTFKTGSIAELRIRLREQGLPQERVSFNDAGNLNWDFVVPDIAP